MAVEPLRPGTLALVLDFPRDSCGWGEEGQYFETYSGTVGLLVVSIQKLLDLCHCLSCCSSKGRDPKGVYFRGYFLSGIYI